MDENQAAPESEIPSEAVIPEAIAPVEESAPAAEESDDSKRLRGVERRINRLARERAEARVEADFYRNQYQQAQQTQQAEPAYEAPLTRSELEAEFARRQSQQAEADREVRVGKKLQGALKADKDFAEALQNSDVQYQPQQLAILRETLDESEHAVELMRYLAKNPDEAERLAEYTPTKFARELGRLEDRAKELAKPQSSNAPKPIDPVRAQSTPSADPFRMSDPEFAAWRRAQISQRGRG